MRYCSDFVHHVMGTSRFVVVYNPYFSVQICGDSNITVFNEAAEAGVSRAAFISVHDYKLPGADPIGFYPACCILHALPWYGIAVMSISNCWHARWAAAGILPGQEEGRRSAGIQIS